MTLNIKLKISSIILVLVLSGCTSLFFPGIGISPSIRKMVNSGTFEVLVKRPVTDKLKYEKDLPYDLLPYNIRNDEYYSIGTAFAISETELLSAFHVIQLDSLSLNYKNYYIRDVKGNVYEIESITGFNKSKDYIRFTVAGKRFDEYFTINQNYIINETVYSVGNAYGEGIIIRGGTLIGTIEEPEKGAWKNLKSSSDVNSGNSGGPLLNNKGEVIGIVSSKKDNIAYSLPVKEVFNDKAGMGFFHYKYRYSFDLFPEMLEGQILDFTMELPQSYHQIIADTGYINHKQYEIKMDQLFRIYNSEIFPTGKSSLEALYENSYSFMPQVVFKDKTTLKWVNSDIETKSEVLHDNGYLFYSRFLQNSMITYIEKPDDITVRELNENSKLMMDSVLEGISFTRKFAGQDIRILSYGSPESEEFIVDKYNRKWKLSRWSVNYSDEVLLTYSMPSPKGAFAIIVSGKSSDIFYLEHDYRKILDFMELSYYGTYSEWKEFLELKEYIPERLKDVSLEVDNNSVSVNTTVARVDNLELVVSKIDKLEITLDYDFFNRDGSTVWDIRRIIISEEKRNNYLVLYYNQRPYNGYERSILMSGMRYCPVNIHLTESPI